jgi:nitrite reductase (NADH) small subunit
MAETLKQVELGPIEAIPPGAGRTFVVGKDAIAVFRTRAGRLFATQAFCPHTRAQLADGMVGGTAVTCPLHSFTFDLESGGCLSGGASALRSYAVSASSDGQIWVEVPGPERPGPVRGRNVALLEARQGSEAPSRLRRL